MTEDERNRHAASICKAAEVFELAGHPPLKALGYAFEQEVQKLRYAQAFVTFFMRPPTELGTEHVRQWVMFLLTKARRNPSTVNVAIAALRFLYDTTLQRPNIMQSIRYVRKHYPQPDVLSGSEVAALIGHARMLKHRAMFMLLYGVADCASPKWCTSSLRILMASA